MKSILLVSIFSSIGYSCLSKDFSSVSKQIEKECLCKTKWKGNSFDDLRRELYKKGALNFINLSSDSLYFLEGYDIESGTYKGRIWNKSGEMSYTYDKTGFKLNQQNLFTDKTIQLIQNWDTSTIFKDEKVGAKVIHEQFLSGTLVVGMDKSRPKIYCIKFKEFYGLENEN